MILTLDVGNSQIYMGVFDQDKLKVSFRKTTQGVTSDELGIFLRAVLRENNIQPQKISHVALCSVVPDLIHTLKNCCKKYFGVTPFVLQPGVKTGLAIRYRNPAEVGSDRIANAIAAAHMFPGQNAIIVDYGTATTFCALTKEREYLGGVILPGLRISMEALESRTAKLPMIEIRESSDLLGRTTEESIRSGLFFGNLAILKDFSREIRDKHLSEGETILIGTGGFSSLFQESKVFDVIIPDMVLQGVYLAYKLNC